MKITFLGTGAAYPRKKSAFSSTLVETGSGAYIIDTGAPITKKLLDFDKKADDVRAVFLTHSHSDHVIGLPDLIKSLNELGTPVDCFFTESSLPEGIRGYLWALGLKLNPRTARFSIYTEGVIYEKGGVKVTAISNGHMKKENKPSYSFVLEAEGKRVVFSGDITRADLPRLADIDDVDLFVLELTHIDLLSVCECLGRQKVKCIAFNHIGDFSAREEQINNFCNSENFPYPVLIAYDGLSIEI